MAEDHHQSRRGIEKGCMKGRPRPAWSHGSKALPENGHAVANKKRKNVPSLA
jgi:hypothetical protein